MKREDIKAILWLFIAILGSHMVANTIYLIETGNFEYTLVSPYIKAVIGLILTLKGAKKVYTYAN